MIRAFRKHEPWDIGSAKVIRIQSYRKLNTSDSLMEIIEGESDT